MDVLIFPLILVLFLVPLFLSARRQKREQGKILSLQDSLVPGDEVLTTAGLHATVVEIGESTVDLLISPGVVTTWEKAVVRSLLEVPDDDEDADAEDADDQRLDGVAGTPSKPTESGNH